MLKKEIYWLLFILVVFNSCKLDKSTQDQTTSNFDLSGIQKRDTLIVGTLYGATSYFIYREEILGFDYEMVQNLAKTLNVELKIVEVKTEEELAILLREHKIDLAAYNTVETNELKKHFQFVFAQEYKYQVLIQNLSVNSLTDVLELKEKEVYVKPNTIFERRLKALNAEIGGTINIKLAPDSVSSDELIEMVAAKKIKYTTAYYNTALLYKSYYKKLDVHMPIGFNQRNGWMIRKENVELQKAIENWEKKDYTEILQANLTHKYWNRSIYFAQKKVRIPKGAISPYDKLFKKYAKEINWDWQLLAAVAFHESRFDSSQVSWAGAAGLMQLMPRTAANFGLNRQNIFNPEKNIEAGVQYIKSLNLSFRRIENRDERIKFILAGYNSGPAHIFDAMALAKKHGKNPQIWFENVEYYLKKKSDPEFYNDPVVKFGKFRSKETVSYVINTLETYEKYLRKK